jgi:hypothetical protein
MTSLLLFASGVQDDPIVALVTVTLIVCFVFGFFGAMRLFDFIIRDIRATNDVIYQRGVPYCPRCNRQVSLRREYCRSCDYGFRQRAPRGPSEPFLPTGLAPWLDDSWARAQTATLAIIHWFKRFCSWFFRIVVCFGWLRYLPGWVQPLVIGTALSIPVVAILAVILRKTLLDP